LYKIIDTPILLPGFLVTNYFSYKIRMGSNNRETDLRRRLWDEYTDRPKMVDNPCFCCRTNIISVWNFDAARVLANSNKGVREHENLRPICRICNQGMGTNHMFEWMRNKGYRFQQCIFGDCLADATHGWYCKDHHIQLITHYNGCPSLADFEEMNMVRKMKHAAKYAFRSICPEKEPMIPASEVPFRQTLARLSSETEPTAPTNEMLDEFINHYVSSLPYQHTREDDESSFGLSPSDSEDLLKGIPPILVGMSKDELKDECRRVGLAVSGNKDDLIDRIETYRFFIDLENKTVHELQEKCREIGLNVSFEKNKLIDRLRMYDEIKNYLVVDLKNMCREIGLPSTGVKAQLIIRLVNAKSS